MDKQFKQFLILFKILEKSGTGSSILSSFSKTFFGDLKFEDQLRTTSTYYYIER